MSLNKNREKIASEVFLVLIQLTNSKQTFGLFFFNLASKICCRKYLRRSLGRSSKIKIEIGSIQGTSGKKTKKI